MTQNLTLHTAKLFPPNNKLDIRAIFSDFDGSQLKTNAQKPTNVKGTPSYGTLPYSYLLIDEIENGLPLFTVTGRPISNVTRDMFNTPYSNLPGPCAARTEILVTSVGTEAYQWDPDQKEYTPIEGLIDEDAGAYFEEQRDYLKNTVIANIPGFIPQEEDKHTRYKVSGWGQPEEGLTDAKLLERVKDTLKSHDIDPKRLEITVSVQSTKLAVDLTPKGATKKNAVRKLTEMLGLKIDQVAFFGDSGNDLAPMLIPEINVILAEDAQDGLRNSVKNNVPTSKIIEGRGGCAKGLFNALTQVGCLKGMPAIPEKYKHLTDWQAPVPTPQRTLPTFRKN